MGYQSLLVDRVDGIATLTMNRPEARNALDIRMRESLAQHRKYPVSPDGAGDNSRYRRNSHSRLQSWFDNGDPRPVCVCPLLDIAPVSSNQAFQWPTSCWP